LLTTQCAVQVYWRWFGGCSEELFSEPVHTASGDLHCPNARRFQLPGSLHRTRHYSTAHGL